MVDREIPLIHAQKTKQKDIRLDDAGFFVIELHPPEIRVEYYINIYKENKIVSGRLEKVFVGTRADALCDTIAKHIPSLQPDHYMYLGRELQKAYDALQKNERYIQDGC
ncbi:MAG: DUF4346 domain-containing protein [Candidatus Thermoplasmatota archaeon]